MEKAVSEDAIDLIWTVSTGILQAPGTAFVNIRATDEYGVVKWSSYKAPVYIDGVTEIPDGDVALSELEQMEIKIDKALQTVDKNEKQRQNAEEERIEAEKEREEADQGRDETMNEKIKTFDRAISNAEGHATTSRSYALGDTGTRNGEERENAKYYYEESKKAKEDAETARKGAEEARDKAENIVGIKIATTEKEGIVKPDGTTIDIKPDGTISTSVIEPGDDLETADNVGAMTTLKTAWTNLRDGLGKRFAWAHVKSVIYDYATNKLLKTKLDEMDALIDEKIAKAMLSNIHVNDVNKVPTSALAYSMEEEISRLNDNLLMTSTGINKSNDWNNIADAKIYWANLSQGSGGANYPNVTGEDTVGFLKVYKLKNNTETVQEYMTMANNRYARSCNGGTWTKWDNEKVTFVGSSAGITIGDRPASAFQINYEHDVLIVWFGGEEIARYKLTRTQS